MPRVSGGTTEITNDKSHPCQGTEPRSPRANRAREPATLRASYSRAGGPGSPARSRAPRAIRSPARTGQPAATSIWSHRAVTTRRMCPWAKATASPPAPRIRSIAWSARAPTSRRLLTTGTAVRPQVPAGIPSRGSGAWSVPRTRRSPTRAGPRRSSARSAKPAISHVSRARSSGLVKHAARSPSFASAGPSASARSRPLLGQRQVGTARVLAAKAPLGLAVAD